MGAPSYGGGLNDSPSEGNALDAIREQTSKIEDMLDSVAEPVKPYATPLPVQLHTHTRGKAQC
jgi:hypothetical protein